MRFKYSTSLPRMRREPPVGRRQSVTIRVPNREKKKRRALTVVKREGENELALLILRFLLIALPAYLESGFERQLVSPWPHRDNTGRVGN